MVIKNETMIIRDSIICSDFLKIYRIVFTDENITRIQFKANCGFLNDGETELSVRCYYALMICHLYMQ